MTARFVSTNKFTIHLVHLLKTKAENENTQKKRQPKLLLLNFQYFELEQSCLLTNQELAMRFILLFCLTNLKPCIVKEHVYC
jgi:hypothetical protein